MTKIICKLALQDSFVPTRRCLFSCTHAYLIFQFTEDTKKKDFSLQRIPKKKKMVVCCRGTLGQKRAQGAAACYPSTDGSGQWSLLCEASLTPCLPTSGPERPRLSPKPLNHYSTWNGQASIVNNTWTQAQIQHQSSTPPDAPTWATSSRYWARRCRVGELTI